MKLTVQSPTLFKLILIQQVWLSLVLIGCLGQTVSNLTLVQPSLSPPCTTLSDKQIYNVTTTVNNTGVASSWSTSVTISTQFAGPSMWVTICAPDLVSGQCEVNGVTVCCSQSIEPNVFEILIQSQAITTLSEGRMRLQWLSLNVLNRVEKLLLFPIILDPTTVNLTVNGTQVDSDTCNFEANSGENVTANVCTTGFETPVLTIKSDDVNSSVSLTTGCGQETITVDRAKSYQFTVTDVCGRSEMFEYSLGLVSSCCESDPLCWGDYFICIVFALALMATIPGLGCCQLELSRSRKETGNDSNKNRHGLAVPINMTGDCNTKNTSTAKTKKNKKIKQPSKVDDQSGEKIQHNITGTRAESNVDVDVDEAAGKEAASDNILYQGKGRELPQLRGHGVANIESDLPTSWIRPTSIETTSRPLPLLKSQK